MPLTDEKLVEMAENVAVTRTLAETHDKRLEKVEEKVDTMQVDINDLKLSWDAEDTQRAEIRTSVNDMKARVHKIEKHSNGGLLEQMKPKDLKAMLKWGAIIVSFLVVGSAGGEGLKALVTTLVQMLTVMP